jgi:hypothetical protein
MTQCSNHSITQWRGLRAKESAASVDGLSPVELSAQRRSTSELLRFL